MNFVHVPRTGGTSIEAALGLTPSHIRASETASPRFAFVRHPIDRLISGYSLVRSKPVTVERLEEWVRAEPELSAPMTYWLDAEMEFVGRYESLVDDFARISPVALGRSHSSVHQPLDAPSLRWVRDRYHDDFITFGYDA